jgi:hypothetical protein
LMLCRPEGEGAAPPVLFLPDVAVMTVHLSSTFGRWFRPQ